MGLARFDTSTWEMLNLLIYLIPNRVDRFLAISIEMLHGYIARAAVNCFYLSLNLPSRIPTDSTKWLPVLSVFRSPHRALSLRPLARQLALSWLALPGCNPSLGPSWLVRQG